MLEYRRDQQNLRMSPTSGDAHILQWAKNLGDILDHQLRTEFYHIQHELAQIIMKEVLKKNRDVLRGRENVAGICPNTRIGSASRPETFHVTRVLPP